MVANVSDLKNKKVAVLGYGVNNRELTLWLVKHGVDVTVCDENMEVGKEIDGTVKDKIKWQVGIDAFSNLSSFDYLFRTPGLRPDHPAITRALEGETPPILSSQTELFFALSPALTVGITGTKGKGTTSSLLFNMLKEGKKEAGINEVYIAGNIGHDPFSFLDDLTTDDVVVLELSSFQLMGAKVRPHIAIMLSLTPDHLDYHLNVHEYIAAKSNLIRYQGVEDYAIFHNESEALLPLQTMTKAQVYTYSRHERVNRGAYVAYEGSRQAIFVTGQGRALLYADEIGLIGEHNLENTAAAALAAHLLGVGDKSIALAAHAFTGLPHRLQKILTLQGVDFIDDSIATTPEAAIAGIQAFTPRRVHWIAGGVSKGSDYRELVKVADEKCATVTLMGRNAPEIATHFKRQKPTVVSNMQEAVSSIAFDLKANDVVLLSPASASFDLYKNYAERGEDFARQVKEQIK